MEKKNPVKNGKIKISSVGDIEAKPVHWLWETRIPLGSLTLLAGREGIGKSTLAYNLAAQITKGTLPGYYYGKPRSVIIIASEDSWEFTIVPRLVAAEADLDRVLQLVWDDNGQDAALDLRFPHDLPEIRRLAEENDVALILLDPLMSRIGGKLDTHKDSDVRRALEPLVKMAGDTDAAVLGLLHVNKSGGTDALNTLMGSRAFSAVARAVLYVVEDPEVPETKWMGQAKSNLGPKDMPDPGYTIKQTVVGEFEGQEIVSSYLVWSGTQIYGKIHDVLSYRPAVTKGRPIVVSQDDRKVRILNYKHANPDPISKTQLAIRAGGNKQQNFKVIDELIESEELLLTDNKEIIIGKCEV